MNRVAPAQPRLLGLSRNVFFLGVVSFLADVSGEMLTTLLPLFLSNVLGVGFALIGLIEGVAEGTATGLKTASGWLSDRIGRRKGLTAVGYGIAAAAKPFLYLASSWGLVLGIRFADRLGKGIRTSPRDALLADSTTKGEMGKSFGFHRAMDTFGAVLGLAGAALVVFLLQRESVLLTRDTFRLVVIVASIPAALAVLVLLALVREVKAEASLADPSSTARVFSPQFNIFLLVMVVFTLGSFSQAFLVLRAQNLGFSVLHIVLLLLLFNIVYTLVATPAGILSDRWGKKRAIAVGWAFYVLAMLGFALAGARWQAVLLFVAYGLYFGASEGTSRAFVADAVGRGKRGTAYGVFHGALGLSTFSASLIAGALWQGIGPAAPFYFGASLAGLSLVLLLTLVRR